MSDIKLYQGDCLELMKDISNKSVDMILCDLPYGTTVCKWDIIIPFDRLWEQYNRIIKDNGAIVLFGTEPFSSKLRCSNLDMYKYDWIWKKHKPTNPLSCSRQAPRYTENISVFYKRQPTYNAQKVKRAEWNKRNNRSSRWYIDSTKNIRTDKYADRLFSGMSDYIYQGNILEFPNGGGLHPTQKPVALCEYLIKTYTNKGDLVLDNCMGSGTTGVACKKLGRNFIGMEKDKGYFEIAKQRIENITEKLF